MFMKVIKNIWFFFFPLQENKKSINQFKNDPSIQKLTEAELGRHRAIHTK